MPNEVFANGNAIACKSGDGKVIAALPDVCLTPPPPPAGPIPVPYPNTSFSRDMQNGSKTVKINGSEVMLKDQSFYKTSPLGDEAATNGQGACVITHVITGKTYFNAWSMDVKFEGQNVDRHFDLTTSNHASYPGSTGPMSNAEKLATDRIKAAKCPCCGKKLHAVAPGDPAPMNWTGDTPMNRDEWYEMNIKNRYPNPVKQAQMLSEYKTHIAKAKARPGCTCKSKKTKVLPEPPCDVFFSYMPATKSVRTRHINAAWRHYKSTSTYATRTGTAGSQVNHLTPKSAGGCPTGNKNLQPHKQLCGECQKIDKKFEDFQ